MANQLTPADIQKLYGGQRANALIRNYDLYTAVNARTNAANILARPLGFADWQEFYRDVPFAQRLLDSLRASGAISREDYLATMGAVGTSTIASPTRLPTLPSRLNLQQPPPLLLPAGRAQRAVQAVQVKVSPQERRLEQERKLQQRIQDIYAEAKARPLTAQLGTSSELQRQITQQRAEMAYQARLDRILRGPKQPNVLASENKLPALPTRRVEARYNAAGRMPSRLLATLNGPTSDALESSPIFDEFGNPRVDVLALARRSIALPPGIKSGTPQADQYRKDQLEAHAQVQVSQRLRQDEIRNTLTKHRLAGDMSQGITAMLNSLGAKPPAAVITQLTEELAGIAAPAISAVASRLENDTTPLHKTQKQVHDFAQVFDRDVALQKQMDTAVRKIVSAQLAIKDPAIIDHTTRQIVKAAGTIISETGGEAVPSRVVVHWKVDPTGHGITEEVRIIDIGRKGQVNITSGENLLTQHPNVPIGTGGLSPTRQSAIQHAYSEAHSRELKTDLYNQATQLYADAKKIHSPVERYRRLRDARQALMKWQADVDPNDQLMDQLAGRDPDTYGQFRKEYDERIRASQHRAGQQFGQMYAYDFQRRVDEFTQNPFSVIKYPFESIYSNFIPRGLRERFKAYADRISGQEAQLKTLPWLNSEMYTRGMMLHWLSELTGWVDVAPNGKLTLGPVKWMNHGYRNMLYKWSLSNQGRSLLDFEKNFIDNLTGRGTGSGLSLGQAHKALNLDFKKNFKAKRARAVKRYINGEIGIIGALISATIGSAISAGVGWVLNKTGLVRAVNEIGAAFGHIRDAYTMGGGIASPAYAMRAQMEWAGGMGVVPNKLRGAMMKGLSGFGRYVMQPLRTTFTAGSIVAGNVLKGAGIYLLGTALLGANPVTAAMLGGGYAGYKIVDGFLSNRFLNSKYLGNVKGYGNFWRGAHMGEDRAYRIAQRLAKSDLLHTVWDKIVTRLSIPFLAKFPFGYHKTWARLVQAYNTSWLDFDKLNIPRGYKTFSAIFRNIPVDGIMFSLFLSGLGVPLPLALAPVGIDLGIKAWQGLRAAAPDTWFSRLLFRPFAPISAVFDIGVGMMTLAESGGIIGLWDKLTQEGFTLGNIGRIFGVLSPYIGIGSLAALLAGGFTLPVLIVTLVTGTGLIIIDQILRAATGIGIWENVMSWAKKTFPKLFENLGESIAGIGSGIIGLIGLFQSLLKGDVMGVAISLAFLILGGSLLIENNSFTELSGSYETPAQGGAEDIVIDPESIYISDISKQYEDQPSETQVSYEYEYRINSFSDNDISSITISENDKFNGVPSGAVASVSPADTFILNNNNLSVTEQHSSDGRIRREFTITLNDTLKNLLPSEDDKLCNILTISIDEIIGKDGNSITNDEEPIIREVCINGDGELSGELKYLPVKPSDGAIITSCHRMRKDPFCVISCNEQFPPGPSRNTCIADCDESLHAGIDIAAPQETNIYAVGDGIVDEVKNLGDDGLGLYISIDHGNNKWSFYGHLLSVNVTKGKQVSGNQVIGKMDSTGYSTASHIHFALSRNSTLSRPYNPCNEELLKLCTSYTYLPEMEHCTKD
ncbi:MAG: M23 family metallopeptidase [Patescibacteria group bacterium]|nr:M23 family metallopeptidase [Patescibacteria group bacterium]